MTEFNVLIDSSVWLDYFLVGSRECAKYIDSTENTIFTSALSLHEVRKRLIRKMKPEAEITEMLGIMKIKSIIVPADERICEKSAEDAVKNNLTTADSIIYRSAQENNALLVTLDTDFKGKKDAKVL